MTKPEVRTWPSCSEAWWAVDEAINNHDECSPASSKLSLTMSTYDAACTAGKTYEVHIAGVART